MESCWGQGEHVQVIHPGGDCIAGRDMVRGGGAYGRVEIIIISVFFPLWLYW